MRFLLILLANLLFISTSFAQLIRELNAIEAPQKYLDEAELQFVQQYNEAKRWQIQEQGQSRQLLNEGPVFLPDWENLGPNTIDTLAGRMLCLDFHPDNPDILFAGSGAGGLWKSENAGESWIALTDDLPSMRVSAVAVNPLHPNELLIGTGIGRVLSVSLQPGVGVLKSVDGGRTWSLTSFSYDLSAIVSTYKIVYDPFVENKVYLAATNGFFVSTDGGDTWMATNNSRVYDIEVHPQVEGTLFIGTHLVGVQKSTDGGMSWTTLTNGIPSGNQIFRTEVAICQNSPDIVVAKLINNNTFNTAGLYKSVDNGTSWSPILNAPDVACQPSNPTACSGWLFNTLGIAPDDPDKIFLGGVQFWYTHDGGNTWAWKDYLSNGSGPGNTNLVYVDHWDIDFDLANPGRMYVCCDGGVIRSMDYGITWTRMSNDLVNGMSYSSATHPENPNFMIGGFHDHGLQRWIGNNDNLTWTRWSFNDGIKALIDPQNEGVVYGNTQNGPVIKSITNGSGISTSFLATNGIQESGPWISPLVMNHENTNILYTASNLKIYKTINGANSWTVKGTIPNVQTLELSEQDPDIVYAHAFNPSNTSTAGFYRSEDGGNTWANITNGSIPGWGTTALESDPHQEGRIYAVRNGAAANSDHIKISNDHGDNWTDITNDFPDIRVNDILVSPYRQEHLFLATDLGVYFSDNGGASWCPFNNNLPRIYCMDLSISESDSTLRLATLGRGIWKTSLPDLLISRIDITDFQEKTNIEVYPNPASDVITIRLNTREGARVKADLYDQQGRKVQHLFAYADKRRELEETVLLDNTLTESVYYIRLLIGNYVYHKKLILLR